MNEINIKSGPFNILNTKNAGEETQLSATANFIYIRKYEIHYLGLT